MLGSGLQASTQLCQFQTFELELELQKCCLKRMVVGDNRLIPRA